MGMVITIKVNGKELVDFKLDYKYSKCYESLFETEQTKVIPGEYEWDDKITTTGKCIKDALHDVDYIYDLLIDLDDNTIYEIDTSC